MIKTAHRHRHECPDLTQREIDLAFCLKDKRVIKLFTIIFKNISQLYYFNVFWFVYFLKEIFNKFILYEIY